MFAVIDSMEMYGNVSISKTNILLLRYGSIWQACLFKRDLHFRIQFAAGCHSFKTIWLATNMKILVFIITREIFFCSWFDDVNCSFIVHCRLKIGGTLLILIHYIKSEKNQSIYNYTKSEFAQRITKLWI